MNDGPKIRQKALQLSALVHSCRLKSFEPLLDVARLMPKKWASIAPQTVGLNWVEDEREEGHWELDDPEEEIDARILKVHSDSLRS